ncbi:MAG: condensation domain-containing protein [Labedaea sp.]
MRNPTSVDRRPATLVELPLLPQQGRWLSAEADYPDATTPLVQLVHRLRGPLDVAAWTRAVSSLVDRYEILHTHFRSTSDGPVQVVDPPVGLAVELIDFTGRPEPEESARQELVERQRIRFDLGRGPLVRSVLIRLAEDDHVWAMLMHHSVADGVSSLVLDADLGAYYRAFAAGGEADLPEPPLQSGDYAVWRAATHRPQDDAADLRYWTAHLAGLEPIELRGDFPRPRAKGAPAAEIRHVISGDIADRVEDLAGATRATRFIVMLTALQVLLRAWSEQDDFCVGIPVAGAPRGEPRFANLIGPFNNLLPLRCDLAGDPTFTDVVTGNRAVLLDALVHQELSIDRIIEAVGAPHDPGRWQLCQVLLVFDEPAPPPVLPLPGLSVAEFPITVPRIPYDLMIHARLGRDGLALRFFYDTGLFAEATVRLRIGEFERILLAVLRRPDARLSELS